MNAGLQNGFGRISTDDQSTALRFASLKRAGCKDKMLFKDSGSASLYRYFRDNVAEAKVSQNLGNEEPRAHGCYRFSKSKVSA